MATRSRYGCIDCKKAKVKCDEVHPACGTCKRRGRQCSGYSHIVAKTRKAPEATAAQSSLAATSSPFNTREPGLLLSPVTEPATDRVQTYDAALYSSEPFNAIESDASSAAPVSPIAHSSAVLVPTPPLLRSLAIIPPGAVQPTDEPFIEVYFMRHPADLVFSGEFVQEMNYNVLQVFQNNPQAVGDTLSAIGEAYLRDNSLPIVGFVPNRKARILARLRNMDSLGVSLELLLTTILGLCAVELVDVNCHNGHVSAIPALMENLAMMLEHYLHKGLELTQLAKYFVRALARQDMMLALTRFHRPRIPTGYWLDDYAMQHADRFMGYTGPMMPLLAELAALAEDILKSIQEDSPSGIVWDSTWSNPRRQSVSVLDQAFELQCKLQSWHPTLDPLLSFETSRRFLMHAYAYRNSALLYLHRLIHPAGCSLEADQTALVMAYEVMVHTTTTKEDMKMSLWPLFLASCELHSDADRMIATQSLGVICDCRKTVTALRTRDFVVNRVWAARDSGDDWNWMMLSQQYPDELLPI
ncbi:hypothetical protein A1O1_04499 [Capronia coronata CBS 617.96]|uniref:Zn(2)-C6 fungal-type domain-containing protein n=1 Tax=Capronia coronata CBS 617.96 TaxID=1182541 RepID=W9YEV6_9EURO|nr:uncharacterized protein A1O1_04499 [Capronia coronata CBS 617.96]EXJ91387.1 hypothetical protein A1O1_04499 [Capronia coronata CBS 617.96]